jgi:hypothetical protein
MVSHVGVMALFALLVSVVFAVLQRDDPWQQVRLCVWLFAGFVGAGVVLGWLMLVFPIGS